MPRLSQAERIAYSRAYNERNKEALRIARITKTYGVDYQRMFAAQGGCCAIC